MPTRHGTCPEHLGNACALVYKGASVKECAVSPRGNGAMKKPSAVILALMLMGALVGCNKNSPTAPTPTPTTQPSGPVTYNIAVRVTDASSGNGIAAARVTVLDGQFAGSGYTVADNGTLTLTGAQGNMNMEATHTGYRKARAGVGPCGSPGCTSNISFDLQRTSPWRRAGRGNNAFSIPSDLVRLRITGFYGDFSTNFVVYINGRLVVNELLGTGWSQTSYNGVHVIPEGDGSGLLQILFSSGVDWSITQVY